MTPYGPPYNHTGGIWRSPADVRDLGDLLGLSSGGSEVE